MFCFFHAFFVGSVLECRICLPWKEVPIEAAVKRIFFNFTDYLSTVNPDMYSLTMKEVRPTLPTLICCD